MQPYVGRQVLVRVDLNNVGGTGADWQAVGLQRGGGLGKTSDKVDATSKQDSGWPTAIVTRTPWSVSVDGALDPQDPVWDYMNDVWKKKISMWIQIDRSAIGGKREEGQVLIDDISEDFPEPELVTYTLECSGNGALITSPDV
jgi:hypothetical protein